MPFATVAEDRAHLPVAVAHARVVYCAGPVSRARVGTAASFGGRQEEAKAEYHGTDSGWEHPSSNARRHRKQQTIFVSALLVAAAAMMHALGVSS